jgi:hypothetical protein
MYCSNSKITVRRGTEVTRLDGKHVFESTTLVDPDGWTAARLPWPWQR